MSACPSASVWLLSYLSNPPGSALLKTIFLDCPIVELRLLFSKLLCLTLQTHFDHGGNEEDPVDKVLNELLSLLDRDVVEGYKQAAQYFDFMREYAGNVSGVMGAAGRAAHAEMPVDVLLRGWLVTLFVFGHTHTHARTHARTHTHTHTHTLFSLPKRV